MFADPKAPGRLPVQFSLLVEHIAGGRPELILLAVRCGRGQANLLESDRFENSLGLVLAKSVKRWVLRKLGLAKPHKRLPIPLEWDWMFPSPFGSSPAPAIARSATWFVPQAGRGSGGHQTIFRFVQMLEERGITCHIVICGDRRSVPETQLKEEIHAWFRPLKASVTRLETALSGALPPSDLAVATSWQTAHVVNAFDGARQKLYFVQDFEPDFYPKGSESSLAEATYGFGFAAATAGNWLSDTLSAAHGTRVCPFDFAVDEHAFHEPAPDRANGVFFYARPPTERRGFALGVAALAELKRRMPDVELHFAGWKMTGYTLPVPVIDHGIVPADALPGLYAKCKASLILSHTNLSLMPLESMAASCVVVSNDGPNVRWMLNEDNSVLSATTPMALADALERVLTDDALHARLVASGLKEARARDWQREGDKLARFFGEVAGW